MARDVIVHYCVRCGRAQIVPVRSKPTPCEGRDKRDTCGSRVFAYEPPLPIEHPITWTENDRRFLARLRIAVDEDCATVRPRRS